MCAVFQEELKTNPHLSTIIQTNLLTKLNQDISGLQLSLDAFVKPLQDFFEEYKGILSLLDEINEKLGEQSETLNEHSTILQSIETKLDIRTTILKSVEYKSFIERIEELEDLVRSSTDDIKRLKYSKRLNELQNQLEAFKRDIIQLAETFQNANLNNEIINLAKQKYDEGKFKEARSLLEAEQITNGLDVLMKRKEKLQQDFKDKSVELLLLAQLTVVDYDLGKKRYETAKNYFDQSLKADRNIDNIFALAHFLHENNQILKAAPLYEEALVMCQKLVDDNKQTYLHQMAGILNNLGVLNRTQNEFMKAEEAHQKAFEIYEQLAQDNQIYLHYMAITLNNLGLSYSEWSKFTKGEEAYLKALEIYEQFNEVNEKHLPFVATILSNLGILNLSKNERTKAEKNYEKALRIRKQLVRDNPKKYLSDLGAILNNLGNLHNDKDEFVKGEQAFQEALEVYEHLSQINPQRYLPNVAITLNNLAVLHCYNSEFLKAENAYQKALDIRQQFANLAPKAYLPDFIGTMINMSMFYCYKYPQKEKSVGLAIQVIKTAPQFQHVPIVMKYAGSAVQVLQKWDIDIESLLRSDEDSQ